MTVIKCIGKQQPSKAALDNFIAIYKEMVKKNQEKSNSIQK